MVKRLEGKAGGIPWRVELRWRTGLLWPGREVHLWWDGAPVAQGWWPALLPYFTLIAPVGEHSLELRLGRHGGALVPQLFLDQRPLTAPPEAPCPHPGPRFTHRVLQRGLKRLFWYRYLPWYGLTLVAPMAFTATLSGLAKLALLATATAAVHSARTWLAAFLDQAQRIRLAQRTPMARA